MNTPDQDIEIAMTLKTLKILGFAIMGGAVIFLFIAILLNQLSGPLRPEWITIHSSLLTGTIIFAFVCLLAARKILAAGTRNAKESVNDLAGKLTSYRTTFIRSMAVMDLAVLLAVIMYMMTGGFPYLAVAAVLLGLMFSAMPSERRINQYLGTNGPQSF